MPTASYLPIFLLLAAAWAIVSLPAFRFVGSAPQAAARHQTIDGLRGFLALAVFIFHVVITHRYLTAGVWDPPDRMAYALLGPVGVSVFFMITGFLFWEKLLTEHGRPRWIALYRGRLFRIAPLYLAAVIVMLLMVFIKTDFRLQVPIGDLLSTCLQWLAIGIFNYQPDVNGYPARHLLAGVTWTISYEWAFYASLPLTAAFARSRLHLLWTVGALLSCLLGKVLLQSSILGFAALFLCGMTTASLLHMHWKPRISDGNASIAAAGCVLALFVLAELGIVTNGYGSIATVLLAIFFYLICSGASLFTLLTTHAARRLGNISYSLYLLQGLVLTIFFAIDPVRRFALASTLNYWSTAVLCTAALIIVASCAYFFIELPGIRLGKQYGKQRTGAALSPAPAASPP